MPAKPKKVHCEKKGLFVCHRTWIMQCTQYTLPHRNHGYSYYYLPTEAEQAWFIFLFLGPGLRTRAVLLLVLLTNNIQLVGFFGHPIFILTHVNTSHGLCDVWEGSVIPGQLHTTYRFSIEF